MADDTELAQESGVRVVDADGQRRPDYGDMGVPLARIVRACHEATIDEGLARLDLAGLDRERLDAVLTYCAELRCEADRAVCPGCRRETLAAGFETLDAYVAAHRRIEIGDAVLEGGGRLTARYPSFDALNRGWAGEEYWFWARRVLRKLRHGIRAVDPAKAVRPGDGATPAIILMEPQLPDNIGMVARAMANFTLDTLRLVAPRDGWPNEKARIAASGANYVVDDAVAYPTLETAIGDLNWLCATTARQRDLRKPVLTPEAAVAEMRRRIGEGQRCGVLFGRERNGLETSEVANADAIVMIPVNNRFASLNLAQAVLVLGYEWMRTSEDASLGRVTGNETPLMQGLNLGDDRLATKEELIGLFEHIEEELDRLGFFNPAHRRATVSRNLRTMLTRMGATEQEIRTFRGIVATLAKGKGHGRKAP
jgi:tRNA/rRNA methyltransferase